ncbi:MAG: hypothetical protein NWS71_12315 [Opitutales bacterium]|jgi:hypothetical protein|nr:hypothetical protein [Opitutales bacterium]
MIKQYAQYALTILISLWFTSVTAHGAQESPPIKVLAIGLENGIKKLEILDAKLQSVGQLSLREFSYSKAFTGPIVEGKLLFGIADGLDKRGKPKFKQIASFEWNDSNEKTALLFIPKSLMAGSNQSTAEYIIQALDMNPVSYKLGHTRIINMTPHATLVRAGEHSISVAAWDRAEMPKVTDLNNMNMAQIDITYFEEGTENNVYQTRMRYLDRIRYTIVIYSDLKNERITSRIIKD